MSGILKCSFCGLEFASDEKLEIICEHFKVIHGVDLKAVMDVLRLFGC